jgi:hypothetical protein
MVSNSKFEKSVSWVLFVIAALGSFYWIYEKEVNLDSQNRCEVRYNLYAILVTYFTDMIFDLVSSWIFLNSIKLNIINVNESSNTVVTETDLKWLKFVKHSDFAIAAINLFSVVRMLAQLVPNIPIKFMIVNMFEMIRVVIVSRNSRILLKKSSLNGSHRVTV